MSNSINLQELWLKQETATPDTNELFEKMKKFRHAHLKRIVLTNLLLLSTCAYLVSVWVGARPETILTGTGISLIILAVVLLLAVYNRMVPTLVKARQDLCSSEYLEQLLKIQNQQRFFQQNMLTTYFILLSAGICMAMFEYVSKMSMGWAVFSYGMTLLWIAINWFWIRPRTIRKQQLKINVLIDKFESLRQQLETSE